LKISKELKAGVIAILAIGLLVCGVNFLKGNSFFGGDDQYTAYFPNSGGLTPATSVYVNGVGVGKVLSVEYNKQGDSLSRVKVVFNIQERNFKIPKGSKIEIGSYDLFNKGILLDISSDLSKGYYKTTDVIHGTVEQAIQDRVLTSLNPTIAKVENLISNVDKTVESMSAFWDTTANSEIKESMVEIRQAIKSFSRVANEVEGLVTSEKVKMSKIFSNLESISSNLRQSNAQISSIIGNTKKITDDLVTAEYSKTIADANKTIQNLNVMLNDINEGKGTIGKLIKDDAMYNELVKTNKELQELVDDIEMHPERYIHFSVLGAKTKGVKLTGKEEQKLRKVLDSIPD
jgi:phospholipid/cholesterol/gamma-HCH transport system substrate-binding protein